jgi:serine O-acetyltransferase
LRLAHPTAIVIGDGAVIGRNVRILQGVTIGGSVGKVREGDPSFTMPRIQDFSVIGPGAVILGPIQIGRGAFIAANAVITKDVEKLTVMGGIPGRRISTFTKENAFPAHYPNIVSLEELFDEKNH